MDFLNFAILDQSIAMSSVEEHIVDIKAQLPEGTVLVTVSKFRPVEQLMEAYSAGQRIFAESRPLEFEAKAKALPDDIEWHFIGHLQTNKLKNVLPYVTLVHSADSPHLIDAIGKYSSEHGITTKILLEVHIGREITKQGFTVDEALAYARAFRPEEHPSIRLCGLMGMASHTQDEGIIDNDFSRIRALFDTIKSECTRLVDFEELSIGMSADWKIALRHGATMVRIGSYIFE